jgi:hypothetical protein
MVDLPKKSYFSSSSHLSFRIMMAIMAVAVSPARSRLAAILAATDDNDERSVR